MLVPSERLALRRCALVKNPNLKSQFVATTVFLVSTMLIGFASTSLLLDRADCDLVAILQTLAQKSVGISLFRALTYLGDFYLWAFFSSVYFVYTYFRWRKRFSSAAKLAAFLIIVSVLTYLIKATFARPRPHCSNVTVYDQEADFSYPSGHVSRATGALNLLSGKNRATKTLIDGAILLVSVSRIILGVHYFTDVIGGVFLSLAAQRIAALATSFLKRALEENEKT